MEPGSLPTSAEEKANYDLHRNSPLDQDYVRFLQQFTSPLLQLLPAASHGLDFGCGPGPTLSFLLAEAGHRVEIYDPFYFPDESLLAGIYDFVSCTEVVEHFHRPLAEFKRLWGLLKPGGVLGIMTHMWDDITEFGSWHYPRDPTHVCIYSRHSFEWLAGHLGGQPDIRSDKVVFLLKA
jgi:2-polyprenyl-3-methyl-5-hydroxy-6-metoxy-1,4-benzoquinol methylase